MNREAAQILQMPEHRPATEAPSPATRTDLFCSPSSFPFPSPPLSQLPLRLCTRYEQESTQLHGWPRVLPQRQPSEPPCVTASRCSCFLELPNMVSMAPREGDPGDLPRPDPATPTPYALGPHRTSFLCAKHRRPAIEAMRQAPLPRSPASASSLLQRRTSSAVPLTASPDPPPTSSTGYAMLPVLRQVPAAVPPLVRTHLCFA
ncbi:uncharacterized protein LOC125521788 [Triticum urartu]|uniref:uncharacterized protein LOC125521788 n=1 Tax=Triticum urartu TaxID=4572 RepID=UPI002044995B|nr:uncharacterized protein LOC125521788 [Triticum urartu]